MTNHAQRFKGLPLTGQKSRVKSEALRACADPPPRPEPLRAATPRPEIVLPEVVVPDEAAMAEFARRLAGCSRRGDILALSGDLGVGKTTFARAFIRAYGRPTEEVPSPTFTLVQVYDPLDAAAPPIYHFDLYRLDSPEDAFELGLEDAFACGISLIEWPDRLGAWLPAARLDLAFAFGATEGARIVSMGAGAAWRDRLAEAGIG